ncbi:thioesterase family protein [Microbacterium sp.]|uniref:thioesterase family protein n=1 Tax=Microbacterium sp. TaxID=51671 RepID=UPI0039E6BC2B
MQQLAVVDTGVVSPDDIDFNDHMNVNVFLRILTETTIRGLEPAGLGFGYPALHRCGLFSVDHHAQYLSELRLGAPYSTHVRLVAASESGVHTVAYLRDVEGRRVAATLESLLLNVDHATRRVVRMPAEIQQRVAELSRAHRALLWPAQVCGAISVPGRAL